MERGESGVSTSVYVALFSNPPSPTEKRFLSRKIAFMICPGVLYPSVENQWYSHCKCQVHHRSGTWMSPRHLRDFVPRRSSLTLAGFAPCAYLPTSGVSHTRTLLEPRWGSADLAHPSLQAGAHALVAPVTGPLATYSIVCHPPPQKKSWPCVLSSHSRSPECGSVRQVPRTTSMWTRYFWSLLMTFWKR